MADRSKISRDWDDGESDAIVSDYFAMLALEQDGRAYVKSRRAEALMAQIGRTHRSVEFKHMNISAVLSELGLPTIRGYKPKFSFQNAIFDAIERHLATNPAILQFDQHEIADLAEGGTLFEEPPPSLDPSAKKRPEAELWAVAAADIG
jgi:hypothetical protein